MARAKIQDDFGSVEAESPATDVTVFEVENPVAVLTDTAKFNAFYERMKAQTDAHTPDLTTEAGRKAISSLAYKVARTKTAIDKAGKDLTEEWRKKTGIVNAARKEISDRLDALRDDVRAPLTKWENAEEKRMEMVEDQLKQLRAHCTVFIDETADDVAARLAAVANASFDEDLFQGYRVDAEMLQRQCVEALTPAVARLRKEESDRAELARLRAAETERLEREAAEQEAAERERQRLDYARAIIRHIVNCGNGFIDERSYPFPILIRELEEKIVIDESFGELETEARQALADNLEKLREAFRRHLEEGRLAAAAEAKEEARIEAERMAKKREEDAARAHAEALAAAQRRADEAEAAQKREADRIAAEKAKANAEAKRVADEQAARESDRAHRAEIMGEAKRAIMLVDVSEETAKKVVLAIVAGEIPHITLRF